MERVREVMGMQPPKPMVETALRAMRQTLPKLVSCRAERRNTQLVDAVSISFSQRQQSTLIFA